MTVSVRAQSIIVAQSDRNRRLTLVAIEPSLGKGPQMPGVAHLGQLGDEDIERIGIFDSDGP